MATRSASKKSPPVGRRRVCASSDPGEFALAVTPKIPRFALAVTSWDQALRLRGALRESSPVQTLRPGPA